MLKVRFLEDCYFLDTRISYSYNEIVDLDKQRAERLYKNGTVDILKDEELVEEVKEPQEKQEETISDDLQSKKVSELKDIAKKLGIEDYASKKKQELIDVIEQVI